MTPDVGILTKIMADFAAAMSLGIGFLSGEARWLLGSMITMDVVLFFSFYALKGSLDVEGPFKRLLKYGFFIYVISEFRYLTDVILSSFVKIGIIGGGYKMTEAIISNPSKLVSVGFDVAEPIFNNLANFSGLSAVANAVPIFFSLIAALIIIISFGVIGIQVLVTYVEFYVFAILAFVLIPFGVFKKTAFLGEKALGGVVSYGIKLAVLTLFASIAVPMASKWTLPPEPTMYDGFYAALGALGLAVLAWQAPNGISSMLGGSPVLSAGSVTGMAASTAMAGVGAGMGAKALAGGAVKGSSTALDMTRKAAAAGMSGAGAVATAASRGGMSGAASFVTRSAMNSAVAGPSNRGAAKVHGAFNLGGGTSGAGGGSTLRPVDNSTPPNPAGKGSTVERSSSPRLSGGVNRMAAVSAIKSAIPNEAGGGGGTGVPLSSDD
ncbi:type IV secretion system protein [Pelobacter seleniigenes]|uniref:type IV secretion system protein n=1 Tax=Pelobacter seleniigenes TaxID=407188 RepID=UPI0004A6C43B|nr:type IV secretion system protein [Pelobacter seleniigenes]